jgi:hypothetical protein
MMWQSRFIAARVADLPQLRSANALLFFVYGKRRVAALPPKHDPERRIPAFGKDHAGTTS